MDGQNLQQDPQSVPPSRENQTLNPQVDALGKRFDKLEADIKSDAKELKEEAKEQKGYLMLGFFILGAMVATMVIMVGGMVYAAFLDQSTQNAQLNSTIQSFMQTYGTTTRR